MKKPMFRNRAGKERRTSRLTWFKLGVLAALLLGAGSLWTPYPVQLVRAFKGQEPKQADRASMPDKAEKKPRPRQQEQPPAEEKPEAAPAPPAGQEMKLWKPEDSFAMPEIVLPPFPPALPERVATGEYVHLNELVNGINSRSTAHFKKGTTATQDRRKKDAYLVRVGVELFQPEPARGEELKLANPHLPEVLPKYADLMGAARVSPWFHALYRHKQNRIRKNAAQVQKLLDRHNFYDTDTILELASPTTGRKMLWLQADMDVVSDGSDGDRLPTMPEKIRKSDFYQPTTSYRWKKRGTTPNPLLPGWQERLRKLQQDKNSSAEAIEHARHVITDLKNYSFLLAEYDPFVVAPLVFKEGRDRGFSPAPGDYAVVIVGERVFPAIVGDYGPNFKAGEASLRLAKLVNPKAQIYARPVSDLGVSYLYFPGSREPENGPIDYARLHSRCKELLDEFGGLGTAAQFVQVEDLLAPPPAPGADAPAEGEKTPAADKPAAH